MAHRSTDELLVSHCLHLKGRLTVAAIGRYCDLVPRAVTAEADRLVGAGRAEMKVGRRGGLQLTETGHNWAGELVAAEVAEAEAGPSIERAYTTFLDFNRDLIAVCSDWQMRPSADGPVTNDHDDLAYDAGVIARLSGLHDEVLAVCKVLEGTLERFAGHRRRLQFALDQVLSGELDYFTRPTVQSYHSSWFELHEDMLWSLGRDRSTER